MSKRFLELKKGNYLAIIPFTEEKRILEIVAHDEEEAYKKATDYTIRYCEKFNLMFLNPIVIRIPDCITVYG